MNKFLLYILLSVFTLSFNTSIAQREGNNASQQSIIKKDKETLTIITNPVKDGYLKITLSNSQSNDLNLTIINSLGKQVYNTKRTINSEVQTFDVSKLSAGIYFLRVSTNSSSFVKKLIIR